MFVEQDADKLVLTCTGFMTTNIRIWIIPFNSQTSNALHPRFHRYFAQLLLICRNYSLQTLCGAPHNVCNDNGIAENLPLNRMLGDYDIIHGTFFVCGLTRDDFTDLTPKQMKHYEEMYHDPQLFFLLGKTLCVEHTTPEGYAQFMQATRQPPRQEQER